MNEPTDADEKFDQGRYWNARHARFRGDPRSVGCVGRSVAYNLEADRRLQYWLGHAAPLLRPYATVLDVGCGYGRAARAFCDHGYRYTGIDVSIVAIDSAREREPRGRYVHRSALDYHAPEPFDLVVALYLFAHFVDDREWTALIGKLAGALRPGGGLLFADRFPEAASRPSPHTRQRPLAMHAEVMAACGLTLDPAFRQDLRAALGPGGRMPPAHLARRR